jgi:predicted GNAT family acetyltransferase
MNKICELMHNWAFKAEAMEAAKGKFEIERDGGVAFLAYETDGDGWISLLHTEVPPPLRGRGIANELAQMGLEFAKAHELKVEVVCPIVFHFLTKHPEYKPLVGIRGYRPTGPQST